MHAICAWIVALAVLLAGPIGSLAECLRCPPDCPMHAAAVARGGGGAGHDEHDGHDGHEGHRGHAGADTAIHAGDASEPKKCHDESQEPAPRPEDGPCLSGVCGHMDPSLARVLPDGVLARPKPLAPILIASAGPPACPAMPARLPSAPPTEPPRSLSA